MKGAVIKRYFFLFLAALFLSLHLALPVLAFRSTLEAKMAQSPAFAREMMRSFGPSAPSGFASSNAARAFGVLGAGGMIAFLAPTPTANSNLNNAIRRYYWSVLRVRVDVVWSFDSDNVLQFDTFELQLNPVHEFDPVKCGGGLRSACFYYWQPRSCNDPSMARWGPARVYGSFDFPATIQSFTATVLERIPQPTGCPLTSEQQNGSGLPNGELAPFFDPTNLVDVGPMAPPEEAPSGVPDGVPVINPDEGDNNIVPFIRPNTPPPPTTTTTNTPPPPTTTTTDTPPPTTTTTNTPPPPTTTTTNTPPPPTTTTTNTPPPPTTTTTDTPPPTTTTTNTPPPSTTTNPPTTTDTLIVPSINPIEPRTFNRPNFLSYAVEKFSNKFPFDIFGTPPPPVNGSECPSYTFFGQTTELCVVRDLIAIMKYPVIIGFAISMYKFL